MPTDQDSLIQALIARLAVVEQMNLTLLAMYARDFETPHQVAAALMDDVRHRMADMGAQPLPGAEQLGARTAGLVDELERRALAMIGPLPGNG